MGCPACHIHHELATLDEHNGVKAQTLQRPTPSKEECGVTISAMQLPSPGFAGRHVEAKRQQEEVRAVKGQGSLAEVKTSSGVQTVIHGHVPWLLGLGSLPAVTL